MKLMKYDDFKNSKVNEHIFSFLTPKSSKSNLSKKEQAEMEDRKEEIKENIEDFRDRMHNMEKSIKKIKQHENTASKENSDLYSTLEDLDVSLREIADYLENGGFENSEKN